MFQLLKLKLFGQQPVANISNRLLNRIIIRDYKSNADTINTKLKNLKTESQAAKNRIVADILKLANKNIHALDNLIAKANEDNRGIIMWAEYPRCTKIEFNEHSKKAIKQIYIDDFIEYKNWLNKKI